MFIGADPDGLAGADSLADQFVQNSVSTHDIAQPLNRVIVLEIRARRKTFNVLASDQEIRPVLGDVPFVTGISQSKYRRLRGLDLLRRFSTDRVYGVFESEQQGLKSFAGVCGYGE